MESVYLSFFRPTDFYAKVYVSSFRTRTTLLGSFDFGKLLLFDLCRLAGDFMCRFVKYMQM